MLFNSIEFLFAFLPITLVIFYVLSSRNIRGAMIWLCFASLFFYGWWNPKYLIILLYSIFVNFWIGKRLTSSQASQKSKRIPLWLGIGFNLSLLGYFKYAGFFTDILNSNSHFDYTIPVIILPLAISFFTFQQIAFLVDSYKGKARYQNDFLSYCVFITFFPQLVAGPIVHHREMMPQFTRKKATLFQGKHIHIGLALLIIGLFKKVCIADNLDLYASPIFLASAQNDSIHFLEAWTAAIAYSLQIYFDFSGYSDMALGLARMFGIRLPVNFFSPYKAKNIIDFWRRWHITLSRFLRDYLYIPLGGGRKGESRKYTNLLTTMLLGGLWHGAGWTFILWGALHGLYLILNHLWQKFHIIRMPAFLARSLTLFCIVIAWVFFRAENMESAVNIVHAMLSPSLTDFTQMGYNLWETGGVMRSRFAPQQANLALPILFFSTLLCLYAPNSGEIMRKYRPFIRGIGKNKMSKGRFRFIWQPNALWGTFLGFMLCITLFKVIYEPNHVFLYFQF